MLSLRIIIFRKMSKINLMHLEEELTRVRRLLSPDKRMRIANPYANSKIVVL
jgi:hypothetical protein